MSAPAPTAGNRLSHDFTQVGITSSQNWIYDPVDQHRTETPGTALAAFAFDGNELIANAPSKSTTNVGAAGGGECPSSLIR